MIERSKQDSMRSLSRAATAVAGSGIGGLVFALLFARPAVLENGFFLPVSLPFAVLMTVVGLVVYRLAHKSAAIKTPATDEENAKANSMQDKLITGLHGVWFIGASMLLIGIAGLIGVLAIIAFIVLEFFVATVLWLARRYF
ncbi:hypothetical protein [Xanthomonas hortorum]|uniref:MFS transporter n=1 Tax=Xanthomonas hortorum pv. vitians TaxID=83224 RepID=A0AAW8ZSN1_9XANT|nr:hypothetical protein [Xanthomonas hortorum]MDV7248931.1 hypothetical protein [Xanthomonas hortorum pv. vitians]